MYSVLGLLLVSLAFGQAPAPTQGPCRDVVFIVDASFSVSTRLGHYGYELDYFKAVVQNAPGPPYFPFFAAINYGETSHLRFDFGNRTKAEVMSLITPARFPYIGGATKPGQAIKLAIDTIRRNARPGSERLIVLMLDWVPQDDTCKYINDLKKYNTHVMIIGIDGTYQRTHKYVTCLASYDSTYTPAQQMVYSTSWANLNSQANIFKATQALCRGPLHYATNSPTGWPTKAPTMYCPQHVLTLTLGPCRVRPFAKDAGAPTCSRQCYNPLRTDPCFLVGTPNVNLCTTEGALVGMSYNDAEHIVRTYGITANNTCIDAFHRCWDTLCSKSSYFGTCSSGCGSCAVRTNMPSP